MGTRRYRDKSFRSIGNDESVQTERFIRRGIKFTGYRCSVTSNRMNCFSFLLLLCCFSVCRFCLSFDDGFSATRSKRNTDEEQQKKKKQTINEYVYIIKSKLTRSLRGVVKDTSCTGAVERCIYYYYVLCIIDVCGGAFEHSSYTTDVNDSDG